jgi:site-specific recombinase XerD
MTTRFFVKDSTDFFKVACQARRLSPNTISDYSNALLKLVAFTGYKPIDQVTRLDIRSFLASQTV